MEIITQWILKHPIRKNKIDYYIHSGDDDQDTMDIPPGLKAPLGPILKKPTNASTPTQDTNIGTSLGTVPLRQNHAVDQIGASGSYESQRLISSFGYNAFPVKEWWAYSAFISVQITIHVV